MTRVAKYLRVMWWRRGLDGRGLPMRRAFVHGYHAGLHDGRGEGSPCDQQCAHALAQVGL